jgi:hypothetical protein
MKCKICLEDYNLINKIPIILVQCGHTFCHSCILQFKFYTCAMCRTTITGLQKNFEIMDYVDNKKTKAEKTDRINGELYFYERQFEKALMHFEIIIKKNKYDLDAHYGCGSALYFLKKYT